MGMPAFFYWLYYGAHSVKSLRRNVLQHGGISPVLTTLIGRIEDDEDACLRWLDFMRSCGRAGA